MLILHYGAVSAKGAASIFEISRSYNKTHSNKLTVGGSASPGYTLNGLNDNAYCTTTGVNGTYYTSYNYWLSSPSPYKGGGNYVWMVSNNVIYTYVSDTSVTCATRPIVKIDASQVNLVKDTVAVTESYGNKYRIEVNVN